jgi:hypothetical protein
MKGARSFVRGVLHERNRCRWRIAQARQSRKRSRIRFHALVATGAALSVVLGVIAALALAGVDVGRAVVVTTLPASVIATVAEAMGLSLPHDGPVIGHAHGPPFLVVAGIVLVTEALQLPFFCRLGGLDAARFDMTSTTIEMRAMTRRPSIDSDPLRIDPTTAIPPPVRSSCEFETTRRHRRTHESGVYDRGSKGGVESDRAVP